MVMTRTRSVPGGIRLDLLRPGLCLCSVVADPGQGPEPRQSTSVQRYGLAANASVNLTDLIWCASAVARALACRRPPKVTAWQRMNGRGIGSANC